MEEGRELPSGYRLGPYEIVQRIGAGGMGTVYEGRDTRLGRTVAIKSSAAQFSGRLEREARAVSSLNHPHICALYDIVEQDGVTYLVMEFVKGTTLADRLAQGPMPFEDTVRYGAQIAGALAAAHANGIVHRDLKPANVMLTEEGVKVLDFGLAKVGAGAAAIRSSEETATQSLTAPHTILGTLQYMAPEQLEGKAADPRTDLFALGTVLYEMLTGRRAFDGTSPASVMAAILEHEPDAAAALVPSTPASVDRIIRRCLAKDPDARWQTASDLAAGALADTLRRADR